MVWSKLWLCLLTLATGLAVAVGLLAPRPLERDLEREEGARLLRAQHAASLLLKVNARKWIDTAAQMAGDQVLVESLDQATRDQAQKGGDLGLVHKTAQNQLRYFTDKMKGAVDLVIATDAKGRVVARALTDEGVYKDGIEGLPLVADALRGLRGDDTWSLDGKLYRVAATPVIKNDRYVGALVVGQEVGSELAQAMKQALDVDVAFLLRGRVLATSAQLPVLPRLPVVLDQAAPDLARLGHSEPVAVESSEGSYLAVLAPFVGEAAGHKAAYALLLPRPPALTVQALLAQLVQSDPKSLPWITLAPVAGGMLIALVLGLLLMRLESDRPLKRLAKNAQALARGEVARLDDDRHPGQLGTVARAVNTTLDRIGSAGRVTGGHRMLDRNPDAVLRSAPLPPPAPSMVSHAPSMASHAPTLAAPLGHAATPQRPMTSPPRSPIPTLQQVTPLPPPIVAPIEATDDSSSGLFGDLSGVTAQRRPPEPPGAPVMAHAAFGDSSEIDAEPMTSPKLQRQRPVDTDAMVTNVASRSDGPDLVDAPAAMPPLPAHPPKHAFGDEVTRAAQSAAAQMAAAMQQMEAQHSNTIVTRTPEDVQLENELEQVWHDFIETKQRLGEPTEGVTYDKFLVKLKANREQLITRYSCKSVKFQVYVKDGKAALKATPVQS